MGCGSKTPGGFADVSNVSDQDADIRAFAILAELLPLGQVVCV